MSLVLMLLGVNVHTSNNGAVINEHPLSVWQVDQTVKLVGLRQPHVVVSLKLHLTLVLSLLSANISMGNLLLVVSFLWSGMVSLALRELVVLFGVAMHATFGKCLGMVKSASGELFREIIRAHSLGVCWCINILKVRCSHVLCLLLMRWLNGMRLLLLMSLLSFFGFNDLLVFWMELLHRSWFLLEVILFDLIISQGLNTGSVPLLSLTKLLVVLLLSSNGLSLGDVILIIVH